MAFAEDLDVFFQTSDFADSASWVVGTSTSSIYGIVDRDYAEPLGNVMQAASPVFTCPAAIVPGVKHGDGIVTQGVTYKVCGVEPDGTGLVTLRLEQQ